MATVYKQCRHSEWANQIQEVTDEIQHYFDTYDSLLDSLEYEIMIIDKNIHKRVQQLASWYYKRHRIVLDALKQYHIFLEKLFTFYKFHQKYFMMIITLLQQ